MPVVRLTDFTRTPTPPVEPESPTQPADPQPAATLEPVEAIATQVVAGVWGNGETRIQKLAEAGYNPVEVQTQVNSLIGQQPAPEVAELTSQAKPQLEPAVTPAPAPQPAGVCPGSIDEIAKQVLAGQWGNGSDRRSRLETAGCDYSAVQTAVNQQAPAPTPRPPAGGSGNQAPSTTAPADNGTLTANGATISGGTAAQRSMVAGIVASYAWAGEVTSVSLNNSGHYGLTQACVIGAPIDLNIASIGGNQALTRQVLVHEIMHLRQNQVYNGSCLYYSPDVFNQFGGFEAMTDCMTQAVTGSSSYLFNTGGCSTEQVRLAGIVAGGSRI
jgi:hypothetical protein